MMQIKQHLLKQGCRWLLPLGLLVCWWQTSLHGWMSQQILPGPAVILQTAHDFIPGDLLSELPISLYRLALGLAGGITAGIILGVAFGLNGRVSRLILPLFTTLVQIPTLAWIPLLMLWLGIGEALKLTILIKAVSVPVALYTCTGIRQISPKLSEMAKILHLSRRMTLKRLVLPALFPYVMTGVRLALSQGWVTLMAVELLASSEGLGYLLVESRQLFMMDQVYICIAVIGVLGYAGEKLLLWLSHRWIRWPSGVSGAVTQPAVPAVDPYGWILPVLLIGGWQWASASGWLNSVFFPAPRVVIRTLITGLQDGPLAQDLGVSIMRMLRGFFLGALAGVLCGLLSGNNAWLDRIFTPFFSVLRSVAIFAWLPLITAWFGLGESARTVFIALSAFFPMFLAIRQGMSQLPIALIETGRVLRLSIPSRLRWLILPGMLPDLFTGVRLGLMHAWVGTLGAEYFISSDHGLGSMMMRAQQLLAADRVMSGIILIALVAALISFIINRAERQLSRWRYQ